MIYLDNAATSLNKPTEVSAAMLSALEHFGNPSRGAHSASLEGLRCLNSARTEIARYIGLSDSARVCFTSNATAALNIAIAGLTGHVITTAAAHNSVLRPIYRHGNYTVIPVDAQGRLCISDIAAAIQPDSSAVVLPSASNVTGNCYDVAAVGSLCRQNSIKLIVDGAQSVGLIPISMEAMGVSALCFSGHKSLYGPQGIGCICLAKDFTPPPIYVGGSGFDSFAEQHPVTLPDAMEAGTQNTHGVAGLLAGLRYVAERSGECFHHANLLARQFIDDVNKIDGVTLYGDIDDTARVPVVSLIMSGISCANLAFDLAQNYDIAVRSGIHCAPLMHRAIGTEESGTVRFSFSHFNTPEDVDTTLTALKNIRKGATI